MFDTVLFALHLIGYVNGMTSSPQERQIVLGSGYQVTYGENGVRVTHNPHEYGLGEAGRGEFQLVVPGEEQSLLHHTNSECEVQAVIQSIGVR